MKITINDKQIDLTPEQEKQITKALGRDVTVEDAWYEPEEGEEYHCLDNYETCLLNNDYYPLDNAIFKRQRVYRTRAEAKKADDYRIAVTAVQKYIIQNFGEWKPEVGDSRHYIMHNQHGDVLARSSWTYVAFPSVIPPLKTREQFNQVIENCEEHLNVIFDV